MLKLTVLNPETGKEEQADAHVHDFNSGVTKSDKALPAKFDMKYAGTTESVEIAQDSIDWTDSNNKDWFARNVAYIVGYKFSLNGYSFVVDPRIIN